MREKERFVEKNGQRKTNTVSVASSSKSSLNWFYSLFGCSQTSQQVTQPKHSSATLQAKTLCCRNHIFIHKITIKI